MENVNFGQAIEAAKDGKKIARSGWNGKNMFVFLQRGIIHCEDVDLTEEDAAATVAEPGAVIEQIAGVPISLFSKMEVPAEVAHVAQPTQMPSFVMKTAGGEHVIGWLASQTDMLANDWQVLNQSCGLC